MWLFTVRSYQFIGIGLFFIVHICVLSYILEEKKDDWFDWRSLKNPFRAVRVCVFFLLWSSLSLTRCRCVVFAPFNHQLNQPNENRVRNTRDMAEENKNDSMCNAWLMRNGRVSKRSKWVSFASSIRSIKLALNETVVSNYHFFDFQCDVVWIIVPRSVILVRGCARGFRVRRAKSVRSRMHFIRITDRGIIYSFIWKYLRSGSMQFLVVGCKVPVPVKPKEKWMNSTTNGWMNE